MPIIFVILILIIVLSVVMMLNLNKLYGLLGKRHFLNDIISGIFLILGTIPPVALVVLWIARQSDYVWAINGPYPFSHLGGGPFMVMTSASSLIVMLLFWSISIWLRLNFTENNTRVTKD